MAVQIRLARHGTKKRAFYRIVVTDGRSSRDGRFIESIGTFNPALAEGAISLDEKRLEFWKSKGAQPSHRLTRALKQQQSAQSS
jgi:small subunit ribosomal protein S16